MMPLRIVSLTVVERSQFPRLKMRAEFLERLRSRLSSYVIAWHKGFVECIAACTRPVAGWSQAPVLCGTAWHGATRLNTLWRDLAAGQHRFRLNSEGQFQTVDPVVEGSNPFGLDDAAQHVLFPVTVTLLVAVGPGGDRIATPLW